MEGHICHLDAHDKFMCSGAVHICVHCQQPFPRIRTLIRHISTEHSTVGNGGITNTVSAWEFLSFSRRHLPWWNSLLDLDIDRPENVCEQNTAFEHLAAGCSKCGRVIRLFQLGSVGKIFGQWVLHMMKVVNSNFIQYTALLLHRTYQSYSVTDFVNSGYPKYPQSIDGYRAVLKTRGYPRTLS